MRLIYLIFLILTTSSIFYFKDRLGLDFFGIWNKQVPVSKKVSAVKPKSLINKSEDLKPVSPQFTFFETLQDKTMTKYIGLHGEVLPFPLPVKPSNLKETKSVKMPIKSRVRAQVKENIQVENKPESSVSTYAIQVSSFRDEKKAGILKSDLQVKGFDAFLMEAELPNHGGKWYRVFLGRYNDQDLARKDAERARQKHKLNSVIVKKTIE
jgi:hypothetical protein